MSKKKNKRKQKSFEELKTLVARCPRVTFHDAQNNAQLGVAYGVEKKISGKDEAYLIVIRDVVGRRAMLSYRVNSKRVLFC